MNYQDRISQYLSGKKTKWLLRHREYTFTHGDVCLKHLFVPHRKSNTLIVVFSGMNPQRASYSYLNLLNGIPHNRLYILDDFGDPVLGCYYRGTNLQDQVEQAVDALLKHVVAEHGFDRLIFCGSSKGGYAALNFGLNYPDSTIITGAPQYYLGYYLTHRRSPQLLQIIAGEQHTEDDIAAIDRHLSGKITKQANAFRGKIYLHYSTQEHTYPEHIQQLLADLKHNGYSVVEDIHDYPNHDDVATWFPPFLKRILSEY